MKQKQQSEAQYHYSPEREKRVASALRENLRKRKEKLHVSEPNTPPDKVKE